MTKSESARINGEKAKLACAQKYQARLSEYQASPKACRHCERPLDYPKRKNTFCSTNCAARVNNQGVRRDGNPSAFCACGQKLTANRNKFCTRTCQSDQYLAQMKATGVAPSEYGGKKYLALTSGKRCAICGLDKWMGKDIPLVLDHVDGHADNNALCNLRLICCNCDAQTPTYKGGNKGNGRRTRRQHYNGREYDYRPVG